MQRLSSPSTFFYKRVFPVFWFGLVAAFLAIGVMVALQRQGDRALPATMPVLVAVVGFAVFRRLIFDLVDEVWLDGEQLVVKNRGESSRIELANVVNVNCTTLTHPPRVTLMLRTPSRILGNEVTFMPKGTRGLLAAFRPNPIAMDLIRRVDALRRRPA